MSRRKTVRVAQLEGRADGLREARNTYSDVGMRIQALFREVAAPSERAVRAAVREGLLEMETTALRDLAVAQRSTGGAA